MRSTIAKFIFIDFSSAFCYLLHIRCQHFPRHPLLEHYARHRTRDTKFRTHTILHTELLLVTRILDFGSFVNRLEDKPLELKGTLINFYFLPPSKFYLLVSCTKKILPRSLFFSFNLFIFVFVISFLTSFFRNVFLFFLSTFLDFLPSIFMSGM